MTTAVAVETSPCPVPMTMTAKGWVPTAAVNAYVKNEAKRLATADFPEVNGPTGMEA